MTIFDNETILTRLILKAFIEHLTMMRPQRHVSEAVQALFKQHKA